MKKFVFVILLVLPIFLMVTISFAGRIFSVFAYIDVESVAFVDELENEILQIKIGKDEKISPKVKVMPELANNKKYNLTSLNQDIALVDEKGFIVGVNYGYATVIVETVDKGKTASLEVVVTNEKVSGVELSVKELRLDLYQTLSLSATILPETAVDKSVTWSSSHPEYVSVDANGVIKGLKVTDEIDFVTITVTTNDGNKKDTCKVTVAEAFAMAFVNELEGKTTFISGNISLDLFDILLYNDQAIDKSDIVFEVVIGTDTIQIDGNILTFKKEGIPAQIKATAGENEVYTFIVYVPSQHA